MSGFASAIIGKMRVDSIELFRRLVHAYNIFRIRFPLLAIKTHVELPEDFRFDESRAVNRGRQAPDGNHYSSSYELDWYEIPDVIKSEVQNLDSALRLYFGGDYLINKANVWRNVGIPEEYRTLDIYSQVWHYDHVVDYRNVQLFVLLTDTTDHHGPFEYLRNPSETQLNSDVEDRNGSELVNADVAKLTGVRGDGMLFATGSMPHRAGIPKFGNHRDIFSIAFFPKYTGIGVESKTLFDAGDHR